MMATATPSVSVVTTADHVPGPPQGHWTYEAYAALHNDDRYEIIDGVLYMAPAPGAPHQSASAKFVTFLMIHVEFAGLGRVFHAPIVSASLLSMRRTIGVSTA
jgi:Uma2 family endonuclease